MCLRSNWMDILTKYEKNLSTVYTYNINSETKRKVIYRTYHSKSSHCNTDICTSPSQRTVKDDAAELYRSITFMKHIIATKRRAYECEKEHSKH